ncbi:DUF6787 family protein [Patiriisocius marinus]|uniref:DUF6787 domain-containing protein n=1 Tax=Patiriisocius marinus TaxID=1397112 RepID=A0A5J4IXY6_9FLAO|nr:DUF6787 family protein [Patiriisocius marinus]GER59262.1 hypothetical protein ULMA_13700 [Patiriisocius marinus]
MKRLKEKWNITTNWQLTVIFIVFAITGSTAAKIAGPVTEAVGISNNLAWYIYWPIRILMVFPLYQVFLVFFGWLFGEFQFFWNFEKKMIRSMRLGFLLKDDN